MSHVNFELPNYPNDRLPFQCNFCHGFPHWHWHKAPELLYGMEGQSLVCCNDRKIVLKPEETVYINPEILHAIESEPGALYMSIRIDPCFYKENDLAVNKYFFKEHLPQSERMTELWQAVYKVQMAEKAWLRVPQYRLAVLALLLEFYENYRETESPKARLQEKYHDVKTAITYIEEHYTGAISLDDISKNVGISKYHLARLFKECTNRTIVEFIVICRIELARNLLRSTDLPIKEVAVSAGFENAPYFSKVFRKHTACTPMGYRALFRP